MAASLAAFALYDSSTKRLRKRMAVNVLLMLIVSTRISSYVVGEVNSYVIVPLNLILDGAVSMYVQLFFWVFCTEILFFLELFFA